MTNTEQAEKQPQSSKRNSRKKKRTAKAIVLRAVLILLTVILFILVSLIAVIYVFEKGPSPAARKIFCITCKETSALKFVPSIFLSKEEVAELTSADNMATSEELTDTDLVQIPELQQGGTEDANIDPDGDGIDIFDVTGGTFKGKMMVVYDPSRVFVGTIGYFGEEAKGKKVVQMCRDYGVTAGINAGGFSDAGGLGSGGIPIGVVITQGKHVWASRDSSWDMVGITNENKLICGYMSVQSAIDKGVRDAVYFGPSLIINGEPREQLGSGSGLNPRAAIGQRADGAMLLLTIDGRQSNSLGASLEDVRDVMKNFGAVNAYNLDGGSSTTMVYNGEPINQSAFLIGYRDVCTGIMVRNKE